MLRHDTLENFAATGCGQKSPKYIHRNANSAVHVTVPRISTLQGLTRVIRGHAHAIPNRFAAAGVSSAAARTVAISTGASGRTIANTASAAESFHTDAR